ncbi:hypothetical protein ACLKA7_012692 [Drosophila subpalustris]
MNLHESRGDKSEEQLNEGEGAVLPTLSGNKMLNWKMPDLAGNRLSWQHWGRDGKCRRTMVDVDDVDPDSGCACDWSGLVLGLVTTLSAFMIEKLR